MLNVLLMFLFMTHGLDSVKCNEYCIVPLQNNSFEDSCLTLSQFSNNFTTYQKSNTTLIFIEGRHTLDNEITVSKAVEFSMVSMNVLYYSEQPIIDCSEHARFIFSNMSHVYISGLTLVGCDNNIVESVNQLIITHSRIIGKGNNSRGLMITKSVVNMSNTFLVSNVIGRNYNDSKCSPITPKLNGNRFGGALKVIHSTLTIERCHFERNTAVIGGAIFSECGSNITITDSMFAMNRATGSNGQVCSMYGGAIVLNSGTMKIHNSSFLNNTSDGNGGMAAVFNAIFLLSQSNVYNNSAGESGGVIASIAKSSIVLEKTNFTFNSAKTGGVLSSEQNTSIIIESSLMLQNTATGNGGVIHATAFSKVTINNTIISNSTAAGFGGVLCTEMKSLITVKNSIIRNTRGNRAGGVVFAINYTTVSVKSSHFINNWGRTSGGVLHLSHNSTAEFDQSFFIENRARYGGGVFSIHNSGTLAVIKGSNFTSNYITEHGGVAYLKNGGSIHVIDSIFDKNFAGRGGGVINGFRKTSINISRSIFSRNKGIMGGGVATIMIGSTLIIKECSFHENVDSDLGAVIHAVNETTTTIHDSQFSQSLANIGGVFHAIRHNTITIYNTTFSNNTARVNGGTLYARTRCSITIVNCYFINNSAILDGVIMMSDNSNITIMGSSFRSNRAGHDGGVVYAYNNGILVINDSYFSLNSAGNSGGVVYGLKNSKIIISNNQVHKNVAQHSGGAFHTQQDSSLIIQTSNLTSNVADYGGVLRAYIWSSVQVTGSVFAANRARVSGGAMAAFESSNITVEGSAFTMNIATFGGVSVVFQNNYPRLQGNRSLTKFGKEMRQFQRSAISVTDSSFFWNKADNGGVLYIRAGKAVIESSSFNYNSVKYDGGSIFAYGESSVDITGSNNFSDNIAERHGGAMVLIGESVVKIRDSVFVRNRAHDDGGTLSLQEATASMYGSIVESASAGRYGGVIHVADGTVQIDDSLFINNTATYSGGVMATTNSKLFISSSNFSQNTASNSGGVIYLFSYSKSTIINSIFLQNEARNTGGAISVSLLSDLQIIRSALIDNVAQLGGAVSIKNSIISFQLATIGSIHINESKKGEYYSMVSSNEAAISGGGVYLENSHLFLGMDTEISNNQASMLGGGVHAINSSIAVESITIIYNNSGTYGGGISMENSKFYGTTESNEDVAFIVNFISNQAKYGGAVYVNDRNQECVCSSDPTMVRYSTCSGCFFENVMNGLIINFNSNIANCSGSDLYGGLLDRCGVVNQSNFSILQPAGVMKLKEISNITNFETISSKPVRVCLCQNSEPDCSQQNYSTDIKDKNGFIIPIAAVDQVQHMVAATILSKFHDLKVSESQTVQRINANCSNLEYQVSFPRVKETYELVIHAQGPCNNQGISTLNVTIYVDECSCPPGFMPADRNTKCDCICDRRFETFTKYIQECNAVKGTVIRTGIFWITYLGTMHDDNISPYFIHPYCPLDYCQPPNMRIPIYLNLPNGSDAQCEKNRGGMLCGDCLPGYSLSLGSSECIKCPKHWYGQLVGIIIAAFFAGLLLVLLLLWLNLTVAVGTLNSIIFYANIINANRITYFGQSRFFLLPSFLSWLNLDIGLNVCFFEQMDIYAKTWIQVAFPAYMIFLVIMIILLSRLSSRFSNLIGKRNPVATLATLILLSYTKLLQTVITTFSFVKIKYPNGTTDLLWLPNANMAYTDHKLKLTILIVLAVVILIFGMLYTVLIFSWQWLLHCPRSKLFKWTRNQKLHSFIDTYHTPNTARHRYWTGMLLVVRVIIYLVAAFSSSSELPTTVLSTVVLMCSLLLYKTVWTFRVYRNWILNTMESFTYFNIALFALFTLYTFNSSGYRDKATLQTLQIASAYVSVGVTFLLLLCVIIYHVFAYSSSTKVHSMASCRTKLMTRLNSHMSSSSKLNIVDRDFVSTSENMILDVLDSPRIITHTSPFVKFEKASKDTIVSPSNDDSQASKI